jgi:hypothetical protein
MAEGRGDQIWSEKCRWGGEAYRDRCPLLEAREGGDASIEESWVEAIQEGRNEGLGGVVGQECGQAVKVDRRAGE